MGKVAIQLLFITFFIVLAMHIRPAASQEVEDEREFSYDPDSERGPANWGELYPEWFACSNGSMQSPIDLLSRNAEIAPHLGKLHRSYHPSDATLRNRGHDMMLRWEGYAGTLHLYGTDYVLQQCHWHSPSEHTIDGQRFDLEAHMVHQSLDGKVAVVGIMYKIGEPDPFLSSIEDPLGVIASSGVEETAAGIIDPWQIQRRSKAYYRYMGSLTTPPCTEGVVWTVVRKVQTVTREQVELLRVAVHDESDSNARPLQPINGRLVQLYTPNEKIQLNEVDDSHHSQG
uniref:Carbonic anhydrase n=2 Tax=Rhizophora mucronata TaxID=61149 RepID=A0A2P2KGQ5_RHIMU